MAFMALYCAQWFADSFHGTLSHLMHTNTECHPALPKRENSCSQSHNKISLWLYYCADLQIYFHLKINKREGVKRAPPVGQILLTCESLFCLFFSHDSVNVGLSVHHFGPTEIHLNINIYLMDERNICTDISYNILGLQ